MGDHISGTVGSGPGHISGSISSTESGISGSITANNNRTLSGSLTNTNTGTKNYNYLINKPSIEGVTLEGNKSFEELNLRPLSNADLAQILV